MPKQKITKEMVLNAAFELARADGIDQVLVKRIAERLECSVQPIYSYCSNMEELRREVGELARQFVQDYMVRQTDPNDLFRSTGQAYIRIAREEPHLFRLFILRERQGISSLRELYEKETSALTAPAIAREYGITLAQAERLHLNMLIYTLGLGVIFSVTSPGIPAEEIFGRQEEVCLAFLKQIQEHKEDKIWPDEH